MSNQDRIDRLKAKVDTINSVSKTFCTAKWLTSTTTLYNGYTHSCHHPTAHKIEVNSLSESKTALHNTPIKIAARQDMLNGVQTKECDYCWNIENLGPDHFSDRHYKSANVGMGLWDRFDETVKSGLGHEINPSYLEVAFENTCNFKCTYCSPDVSSRWMEEVQKHGGYKLVNGHTHHDLGWLKSIGRYPIHHSEHNPYIEKFWEWWPELYQSLNTFRITGGEPLLSNNTWKILDYVNDNPRKELKLSINSNMSVPHKLVVKLVERVNSMKDKCHSFELFTSAESVGAHAEYSRYGMDWELFQKNIDYFMSNTDPSVGITFMTTVDIFASASFDDMIRMVCDLRKKFDVNRATTRVGFGVNYLRWPKHQQITLLDIGEKVSFAKRMDAVIAERTAGGHDVNGNLYMEEVDQIHRLIDWMMSEQPSHEELVNFVNVLSEMDERRETDMLETFPNLRTTFETGLKLKNKRINLTMST